MDGKDEQGLLEYLLLTGCVFVLPKSRSKFEEYVSKVQRCNLPLPENPESLKKVQMMLKEAGTNGKS